VGVNSEIGSKCATKSQLCSKRYSQKKEDLSLRERSKQNSEVAVLSLAATLQAVHLSPNTLKT